MKKKTKKKSKQKRRKLRKGRTYKPRKKNRRYRTGKKIKRPKKYRKIKPKKRINIYRKIRKNRKKKKLKIKKKTPRIKLKKIKRPKFSGRINQFKKLTLRSVVNFIFQPIIEAYNRYKERKKIAKLRQINFKRKERERQIKEEELLRRQIKEREFRDEVKLARLRSQDLKKFIKQEQAIVRVEQAEKRRRFLEEIKLEKKIESFRKREHQEIKNLEKLVLKEQREDYRSVEERLEKIKEKYRLIREQKIRDRVQSLGVEIADTDTKDDLLQKEKEYAEHRQNIELVLESFYRSANSLVFQLNKRYIPKHKSILRVIDRRYETNECFIRYDDSPDDDWLILIYLEDSNPKKGKIIVENKADQEKYETKSFQAQEIFAYSDYLVDVMTAHIDRERQKKAS